MLNGIFCFEDGWEFERKVGKHERKVGEMKRWREEMEVKGWEMEVKGWNMEVEGWKHEVEGWENKMGILGERNWSWVWFTVAHELELNSQLLVAFLVN